MANALLLAAFDFTGAHADEFHDWYDLEHVPERQAIAGFGACERWIGADQPEFSVATYDLEFHRRTSWRGLQINCLRQSIRVVEASDEHVQAVASL